ncbi:MAG: DNA-3-methyladenine glycosylase 2 family protein [Actinomycetota bacterium]|nr:DNA-3-methyladenine glycosylase 2 family protein [Actinomycetota bacterium]
MPTRTLRLPFPVDLRRTLGPIRRGRHDPTFRLTETTCWRATRTADGPVTLGIQLRNGTISAEAWGPGADRALDALPRLVGWEDRPGDFEPTDALVARLHRRFPGIRIGRTDAVVEALVPSILEQKVTGLEARRSHRQIVIRYGEPAPGPPGLHLPPEPATLAAVHYAELHRLGVERKRADVLRRACAQALRLDALSAVPASEARKRLTAVPGIGPWTAAEVTAVALGDADAVSVGDYHLPSLVSWALAGERRGTDERMLELLAPFSGHRGRVIRLLAAAGLGPPRHGPRLAPRNIARH